MANKSNEPPNDTVGYYYTFVRSRIPELKVDPLGVSPAASQNYHPRPSEFFSRQLIVDFTNHMNQATGLRLKTWMGVFSTTITHVTA